MSDDIDLFTAGRGFPMDHLSPSFISKFEECPLKALYYREGRPAEYDIRYAEVGKHIHSILEKEYNPAAEIYEPVCGMDEMMAIRRNQSIEGYMTLRKQDRRFDPREGTQHPEVHVRSEIRGVPIIGFIDLLSIRGSMVYIDDWKTGFPGKRDEQQIRIYTMMISRIMGIPPRDIIATLDYLREEPGRIQKRVPYTSTAAIEQHIEREVIEPINDLQFVPVRGSHCERCEYRKICEAW